MGTNQTDKPQQIAGFWRRLGAFFIDCLLLGIIGLGIGYFLTQEIVNLGAWGRLLGFTVALIYFGLLNSKLSNGQTLGKRSLKIKVVTRAGAPLSVVRSFVRFIPLGVAWFLNDAQLPASVIFTSWIYMLSVAVFGMGLSIIYLYIFNRQTRQSLHDLLVESYVVMANAEGSIPATKTWRLHLTVCTLLLVASGVAPYYLKGLATNEPFASMMNIYRAAMTEPSVVNVQVNKGKSFVTSLKNGRSESTYLNLVAYINKPDIQNAGNAKRLAMLAITTDSTVNSVDVIQVTLAYGYDIGIASSWRSQTYSHSPGEWVAQ